MTDETTTCGSYIVGVRMSSFLCYILTLLSYFVASACMDCHFKRCPGPILFWALEYSMLYKKDQLIEWIIMVLLKNICQWKRNSSGREEAHATIFETLDQMWLHLRNIKSHIAWILPIHKTCCKYSCKFTTVTAIALLLIWHVCNCLNLDHANSEQGPVTLELSLVSWDCPVTSLHLGGIQLRSRIPSDYCLHAIFEEILMLWCQTVWQDQVFWNPSIFGLKKSPSGGFGVRTPQWNFVV